MQCKTTRVKCDNEQGFYVINESDFDSAIHELFTEATDGAMSVAEIKDALTAKGIDIPAGAKKAELKALLEA
jgi:HeH/LEM domain